MKNRIKLIGHYGSDLTHAQKEVRELAVQILDQIKAIDGEPFKYTVEAFGL